MNILPFFFFFSHNKKRKIIFSAEVDFSYKFKREGYTLGENKDYNFQSFNQRFHSKDVENTIVKTIENNLKNDIHDILGMESDVEVKKVSYGSITVFFTVAVGLFYGISKYKNFIESCELIRKHVQKLISRNLNDNFGYDTFDVSVEIEPPYRKRQVSINSETGYGYTSAGRNQRDGFFYFLLIGFLFLATILGILVYHSFMQTYFK